MMRLAFALAAIAASPGSAASIGDRLVLEIEYLKKYDDLPINAKDAESQGWQIQDSCLEGMGRRAEGPYNNSLHLWYDLSGAVMGYGISVAHGVSTPPWRKIGGLFNYRLELDFLFREPQAACNDVPSAVPGSIGDRLLLVQNGHPATEPVEFPLTQPDAKSSKFIDGGDCWSHMGKHMAYSHAGLIPPVLGPVVPVYMGDGTQRLQGLNTPSFVPQPTPPFEYFPLNGGGPVHGHHVYFRDHMSVCGDAPTKPPFTAMV